MFYLACQNCKKKVIDEQNGYRCEKCDKTFKDAVPTYSFSFSIADFTDSLVTKVLGEAGDSIMGMNAAEFYTLVDENNFNSVIDLCKKRYFTEISLLIRVKHEKDYQRNDGEPNITYLVAKDMGRNVKMENEMLLQRLSAYKKMI
jgi:replication factor A1